MAAKVSVKYIGHLPAVEVDLDGLGEQTVVYEETIDASPEVAASLLEQVNNWQLVQSITPAPVKAPTKPEEAK